MDGGVRPNSDDVVHEVEEFDAAPALLVSRRHLAGGHLEGGKQCRGAIALVIVTMTAQCTAVRELQITLRTLQRLDRGLFVDADDNRVLGRRHVEPDYVGGLGYERGILALAPGFASGEVDLLGAQEAPDILDIDIAERRGQERPRPAAISLRRRLIPQHHNAPAHLRPVLQRGTSVIRLVETRAPAVAITHPPLPSPPRPPPTPPSHPPPCPPARP